MKQYDAIIIGFGKGGKLLAVELAERNWKVAIVERSPQMYGGTCVNVGCIPTKALIHESEYAEKRYYDDYKNQSKLYALAVARKDKLVSFLREKNYENVKNKPNITLYDGTASFLSENTIRIVSGKDETILEGKEIFINTGSTPILPAIDGLKESKYVYTSETLLQSNKLPAHLLVIGGGAVGLEFATMYAGFGSHVTLLEAGNRFLPKVDRDIAASMLEALNRKRINVRLNARVQSVYDTAEGITLTYTDSANGTPYYLKGDALLVAIGRKPMTAELNLEKAGIQTDKRGAIVVDNQLRTTAPWYTNHLLYIFFRRDGRPAGDPAYQRHPVHLWHRLKARGDGGLLGLRLFFPAHQVGGRYFQPFGNSVNLVCRYIGYNIIFILIYSLL